LQQFSIKPLLLYFTLQIGQGSADQRALQEEQRKLNKLESQLAGLQVSI
jgi:hypothetical protein